MAITSLTYEAPVVRSSTREGLDYELLEAAVELADQGRPLESLLKVFEHLLPGEGARPRDEHVLVHAGLVEGDAGVENDDVVVAVPLVKLPADGRHITALRYVLGPISATGQLYQPRLSGDDIRLEFRDRLSRLHPAKMRRGPARHRESQVANRLNPLELRGMRPTQGRTLAVMQVCGGSQSFNAVNALRILGRWMRITIAIQNHPRSPRPSRSSRTARMKPSAYYNRVVDVMEDS